MTEHAQSPYAAQAEFWKSPVARPWADEHERIDRALADLMRALFDRASPQRGERVLDIGCGGGTTVLELAARVGPDGQVLGADISEHSVARAGARIAAAGLAQAEVIAADAATHAFPAARFDLAFSRLGVMFFSDPTAAFANVHRAMKPGARVALAVFRSGADNLFPSAPTAAVRHLLPPLPALGPEEPGPLSWADPARVHRILEGAGFRDVSFLPVDPVIRLAEPGRPAEAAEFVMLIGPLARVLPSLSADRRAEVRSTLEAFFRAHDGPGGVALPAANWIVEARA